MTVSLIGGTEAAVRDGFRALRLNVLQHVHYSPKTEKGTEEVKRGLRRDRMQY